MYYQNLKVLRRYFLNSLAHNARILILALSIISIICIFAYHDLPSDSNDSELLNSVCEKMRRGEENTLQIYRSQTYGLRPILPVSYYQKLSEDEALCDAFFDKKIFSRSYSHITPEELNYPIVFSLAIYTDIDHFARLLRSLYRPHNIYIIHVDFNVPLSFFKAVNSIKTCLDVRNIHILNNSYRVNVQWSNISNLYCHYNSMKYLIDKDIKAFNGSKHIDWKYFINLSGQEFPLRTNLELVQILKSLNNSNHIEYGTKKIYAHRFPIGINATFEFKWEKGSVYIAGTRDYCQFVVGNKKSKAILKVLAGYYPGRHFHPDELYFSTLNFNPQLRTPGSCYPPTKETSEERQKEFHRVHITWTKKNCNTGKTKRAVCILGVDSLKKLAADKVSMIANKFFESFEPAGYDCIEHYLIKRAQTQRPASIALHQELLSVDTETYKNLYCTKNFVIRT